MAGREEGGGRRARGGRRREEPARPSGAGVGRGRDGRGGELQRAGGELQRTGTAGVSAAGGGELEAGMGARVLRRPAAVDGERVGVRRRVVEGAVVKLLSEGEARAVPTCKWGKGNSVAHPCWHAPQNAEILWRSPTGCATKMSYSMAHASQDAPQNCVA